MHWRCWFDVTTYELLGLFKHDQRSLSEYRNVSLHSDRIRLLFDSDPSCPGYFSRVETHFTKNSISYVYSFKPSFAVSIQDIQEGMMNDWKRRNILFSHDNCGPALRANDPGMFIDHVLSIRCYSWPPEASEWPKRFRKYNQPDKETVSLVSRTDCHVVNKSPPDQAPDLSLWRASFSAAEVILLNRWIPEQQIVYHMLRYFSKRELEIPDSKNKILCSYHLKTLMLWKWEGLPLQWWKERDLIEICCGLLKCLLKWMTRGHFPNYFMRNCNLLNRNMKQQSKDQGIFKISLFMKRDALADWFESNYRTDSREVDKRNTDFSCRMSRLSSQFSSDDQYTSEVINSHVASLQYKTIDFKCFPNEVAFFSEFKEPEFMPYFCCISDITKVHRSFIEYYKGHVLLQTSAFHITHRNHDRIFQVLCSLFWRPDITRRPKPLSVSSSLIHKYAIPMLKNLSKPLVTETDYFLHMKLAIKLCKISLNVGKHEVVFLAVLYRATQKYSKCMEMIKSTQTQTAGVFFINAKYLLFIDDILHIYGFLVLLSFIKGTSPIVLISSGVLLRYLVAECEWNLTEDSFLQRDSTVHAGNLQQELGTRSRSSKNSVGNHLDMKDDVDMMTCEMRIESSDGNKRIMCHYTGAIRLSCEDPGRCLHKCSPSW